MPSLEAVINEFLRVLDEAIERASRYAEARQMSPWRTLSARCASGGGSSRAALVAGHNRYSRRPRSALCGRAFSYLGR